MVNKNLPSDVKVFEIKSQKDLRGDLKKIFNKKKNNFKNFNIKQVLITSNKKIGTIRGIHFQKYPYSESKLIFCNTGSMYDVFIDMRKKSKNYLKVFTAILNYNKKNCLFLPKGYAHGYQTLSANTSIIYLINGYYNKKKELKSNPFSKKYNINWPKKKYLISRSDLNSKYIL